VTSPPTSHLESPPVGLADLEQVLRSLTKPRPRRFARVARALRRTARRAVTFLDGSAPPPRGSHWELAFEIVDAPQLSHRLTSADGLLRCAPARASDSLTIQSTWLDYLEFYRNRASAQLLFLDQRWRFAAGDSNIHVQAVEPAVSHLEDYLRPAYTPAPRLRDAIRDAARRLSPMLALPRVRVESYGEFASRVAERGTPTVLEGAPGIDPSFDWSWAGLAAHYRGHFNYLNPVTPQKIDIASYFRSLADGATLPFKLVLPLVATLRRAAPFPFARPAEEFFEKARGLILSPANRDAPHSFRSTAWHCDYADNFLTQVIGTKRISLVPPTRHASMYLRTAPASHQNVEIDYSSLDPVNPDWKNHARFAEVSVSKCELGPGDTLYIPCGWFHYVESLSATCSINCWRIRPPAAVLGRS
jgi:hypothetical protein